MPSLSSSDATAVRTQIEQRAPDLLAYLPESVRLVDLIGRHAPDVMQEINVRLGGRYAPVTLDGATDLGADVLMLLTRGVLAHIALDCYRNLDSGEREWVDAYRDDYQLLLEELARGRAELPTLSPDSGRVGAQTASEPRTMTMDDDLAVTIDRRDLDRIW